MSSRSNLEVKSNLFLTVRERGKIVTRRQGHNIWLNLGHEWLASVIAYASLSPLTPADDNRIRYMGFGIGGTRQQYLATANAAPFSVSYPGSNLQTDSNANVTHLERPIRISGSEDTYPGQVTDVWLGQVQTPVVHPAPNQTTFTRIFTETELNYGSFSAVPISEIMLFTNAANPNVYNNTGVAYDTFDTISKSNAFELEINWTIRFGT